MHYAKGRKLCCATSCGSCGEEEHGCFKREGGPGQCCAKSILTATRTCSSPAETGCLLSPVFCEAGIKSDDGKICCNLSCGGCGSTLKGCK